VHLSAHNPYKGNGSDVVDLLGEGKPDARKRGLSLGKNLFVQVDLRCDVPKGAKKAPSTDTAESKNKIITPSDEGGARVHSLLRGTRTEVTKKITDLLRIGKAALE